MSNNQPQHGLSARVKAFGRQRTIFLLGTLLGAISTGIFFSSLNNYLVDIYNLNADARGLLETFRETPGMLLFLFLMPLAGVAEGRILLGATLVMALGIVTTASLAPNMVWATIWIFVWSVGFHIALTLRESFCVALSEAATRGRLFGLVRSLNSLGIIVGAACIWGGMSALGWGYERLYWLAGGLAVLSAISLAWLGEKGHTGQRRRPFVIKKKYSLFYALAVLFGVRKQIFLVFAPWVLIKVFDQDAPAIARLVLVSSAVGLVLKPYLGRLIDRLGERTVLMGDSVVILCICAVYGLAQRMLPGALVLPALFVCFILDDSLFSLRAAHITYLARIVDEPEELTASISTSYSIEHLVSMTAPPIAGVIWMQWGYPWIFALAACVAVLMGVVSSRLPRLAEA